MSKLGCNGDVNVDVHVTTTNSLNDFEVYSGWANLFKF